jgi:zinc transporter, ZIP family
MLLAIWWGGFAATSLLIGYALAGRGLSNRIIGTIMSFGAGALISAIAYELVPESVLMSEGTIIAFVAGAIAFFMGDWVVDRQGGEKRKNINGNQANGSGAAIFIGTLLDAIPESIILGMSLVLGGSVSIAFLVAVYASNLPEGVAGTINLEAAGYSRRKIFWLWVSLVVASAVFAGLGYLFVRWLPGVDGHIAQAFAAGAMLTMLAEAMMPEAYKHSGKLAGPFTVLGFMVAAVLSILQ